MISKIGKVGGPSRRVYPGMVFARKCGKRRADAECLRNRQTVFLSSVPAAEASGKVRPAAAGRVHVLRPGMLERCPLHLRPARSSLPGRSAGEARRPARAMPKPSEAIFPCRDSPRRGGPVINRTRRPGEKSTPHRLLPSLGHTLSRGACPAKPCPLPSGSISRESASQRRQRRSSNRSCGSVRQTQGRARRALLSVRTCAASMFDHEKRGRIGHPPPLSS